MNVPFLGSIPIDPKIGVDADKGSPFVIANPNSAAAKALTEIFDKVENYLKEKEHKNKA